MLLLYTARFRENTYKVTCIMIINILNQITLLKLLRLAVSFIVANYTRLSTMAAENGKTSNFGLWPFVLLE